MDDADRKAAKKIIFTKLKNASFDRRAVSSSSSLSHSAPTTTTVATLNPFQRLAVLCGHSRSTTIQNEMSVDEEISGYINVTGSATSFSAFWCLYEKQFPRLAKLVRRINVIPATSVSSESLFSVASFLQRKQRASLSSTTLRYLLVLKNRHILEKLEQN